jgi:uncharacterized protein YegP (UPF0339 family)
MDIKILEQYTLSTPTASYLLQVFTDAEGDYRWRIMYNNEEVGTCNQGYKSKSSVFSNIEKQGTLLSMFNKDLPNEIE